MNTFEQTNNINKSVSVLTDFTQCDKQLFLDS